MADEIKNQIQTICPYCKSTVSADAYFCPTCGKQLKDRPPDTSPLKQTIIYAVSLFLPPFGLWYVWKYLKYNSYESRRVGIIAIILTLISVILTLWIAAGFINSIFQSLTEINNLGY